MSLFYSVFPMVTAGITTICYVGVWLTIQVGAESKIPFTLEIKTIVDIGNTGYILPIFLA